MSSLPSSHRTLAPTYDPSAFEERWYRAWESQGFFKPSGDRSRPSYCIVMPPPNVTGDLHLGHALTIAVEDIFVRWHRMLGDDTLWIPGTDHAGIPTQYLVERMLAREGMTRDDLGRDRMVAEIWKWTHRSHDSIVGSLRRLGGSCDWSRERFTLDDGLSRAVRTVFVHLYERGLIYRGAYMVNWCPRCATAISDLEVDYEEEQGSLWYIRYPFADESDHGIEVATTRPETMLGDTAVAVHPDDPRYRTAIGRSVTLPIVGRVIPIIADSAVEQPFGTGAVKVTPAHDPTDHAIGERHHLPSIQVIGPDATMTADAGALAGLERFAARQKVVLRLQQLGLLVATEPHQHAVAHCERCRTVVEPLVSRQWFVQVRPLADAAIEAAEQGRIRFLPERFTSSYLHWMRNVHDWCISRQIWWGHRIPIWTCGQCQAVIVAVETPDRCHACGGTELVQELDVLDTWFSSALWPFSTMGWPEQTDDLARYYPTNVLETGYDILFLWVSRMIMMGIEFMHEAPFHDVYLHGLVRDEAGQKMSKTKGNVVDPLGLIDQFGADSLRWSLITGTTPGNDTRVSATKLEAARNFLNKLWNAVRFVTAREADDTVAPAEPGLPERWLSSRLAATIDATTALLGEYQLGEAARTVQEFIWGDLCDWYIEIAKVRGRVSPAELRSTQETLLTALAASVRLLHPFVPFITEEIWHVLPARITHPLSQYIEGACSESIMLATWPAGLARDIAAENEMGLLTEIVRAVRNARVEAKSPPTRRIPVIVAMPDGGAAFAPYATLIEELAKTEPPRFVSNDAAAPTHSVTLTLAGATVYLPTDTTVDLEAEQARLDAEIARTRQQIDRLEQLFARPGFVERAPAHIVAAERERLQHSTDVLDRLLQRRQQV